MGDQEHLLSTSRGALGRQTAESGRAWEALRPEAVFFLSFGCAGSLLLCTFSLAAESGSYSPVAEHRL